MLRRTALLVALLLFPVASAAPSAYVGDVSTFRCEEENMPTSSYEEDGDGWRYEQRATDMRRDCAWTSASGARVDDGEGRTASVAAGEENAFEESGTWNRSEREDATECDAGTCRHYQRHGNGSYSLRYEHANGYTVATSETGRRSVWTDRCEGNARSAWTEEEHLETDGDGWRWSYASDEDLEAEGTCERGVFVDGGPGLALRTCRERYRDTSTYDLDDDEWRIHGPSEGHVTCWTGVDQRVGDDRAGARLQAGVLDQHGWTCMDGECAAHDLTTAVVAAEANAGGESVAHREEHALPNVRCPLCVTGA